MEKIFNIKINIYNNLKIQIMESNKKNKIFQIPKI